MQRDNKIEDRETLKAFDSQKLEGQPAFNSKFFSKKDEKSSSIKQEWTETTFPKLPVRVKKLNHFKGELPEYKSEGASGFDIRACLEKDISLKPGERTLLPTGLSFEIPPGFELQSRPRSGLALKQGLTILNSPGTIDSDYRGEVKTLVLNASDKSITIKDQDRVAQLVLCPVFKAEFIEWKQLSKTKRNEGGFGSTGV